MSALAAGIQAVLLDIEGTTTPITFVTRVLFPYVREHLPEHLEQHGETAAYKSLVARLRDEHHRTKKSGEAPPSWTDDSANSHRASAIAFVNWLMDRDRKSTPLKELQGLIWQDGYARGRLIGELFPDVHGALSRWQEQGVRCCIYSSGSVLAQKLLFQHSSSGDLSGLIDSYFDTNVGAKADPDSYRRIGTQLRLATDRVLFLSDVPRELSAARDAMMRVVLVSRPGNADVPVGHGFRAISSFDQL